MVFLGLIEAVTGFVLWFGFPDGGSGAGRLTGGIRNLTFWEIPKYSWVEIHDWVALALFVIVLIHVVVHWKWLVRVAGSLVKKTPGELAPVPVRVNN